MFSKSLKIFILLYFFNNIWCFSQVKPNYPEHQSIVSQYNDYLTAAHLIKLIRATDFSYQKELNQKRSLGTVKLTGIYLLTIEPDSAFSDPLDFSSVWDKALKVLNGKQIAYWQLFSKLSDITRQSPDSLVILIKTRKPDFVSYMVYFNNGININETALEIRGDAKIPPDINNESLNNESLNNILYGCVFPKVKYDDKIRKDLIKGICLFLEKSRDGVINQAMKIKPVYRADNILFFEARNVTGRITNKYFEDITIALRIIPSVVTDINGKMDSVASIEYSWSVLYSDKKFSAPATIENSENAIIHYKDMMYWYAGKLSELFTNTFSWYK